MTSYASEEDYVLKSLYDDPKFCNAHWEERTPLSLSQRKKLLHQARLNNDIKGFIKNIWQMHDNRTSEPILKGFVSAYHDLRSSIGRFNKSAFLPSYYQFYDNKFQNVWVINNIDRIQEMSPDDSKKITEIIYDWLDYYTSYKKRMERTIEEGFEATLQHQELLLYKNGKKLYQGKKLSKRDFDGDLSVNILLPWVENQEVHWKKIKIGEWNNFLGILKERKQISKNTFTRNNITDEVFKNSDIHDLLVEQAHMKRRLGFVRNKLNSIPQDKRTLLQEQLLTLIEIAMINPSYYPTSGAFTRALRRELWKEVKAIPKRGKGKERLRQAKNLPLMEELQGEFKNFKGKIFGNLTGFWLVGAGFFVSYVVSLFTENTWVKEKRASITNRRNWILLKYFNTTPALAECANATRKFTVEESCYHEFLMSFLSHYVYQGVLDKNPNWDQEPEYINKRNELTQLFLSKRIYNKVAEAFSKHKKYLIEDGYSSFIDDNFLTALGEDRDDFVETLELSHNYIDNYLSNGDLELRTEMGKEIKQKAGEDFLYTIHGYLSQRENIIDNLREEGYIIAKDEAYKKLIESVLKNRNILENLKPSRELLNKLKLQEDIN